MSLLPKILNSFNLFKNDKLPSRFQGISPQSDDRFSDQLNKELRHNFELGQDDLKTAIIVAGDTYVPNRYLLYQAYKEAKRDLHLLSQIRSAKLSVTKNAFIISKNDVVLKDLSKLIERSWFIKVCNMYLDAEFEGHSLMEFQKLIETDFGIEVSNVKLFPREHVIPERGEIKKFVSDVQGLNYRDNPEIGYWFLEAGDPQDLGLLSILAKHAIYKKYALSDWSRYNEKFGIPIVAYMSASMDKAENDKKYKWLKNIGTNAHLMGDFDDRVEMLSPSGKDGHLVFEANIKMQNEENSKGINGQVATSDEKSYSGASEVQQDLMDDYTISRLRSLTFWLNETLLPYLIDLAGGKTAYAQLRGCEIKPLLLFAEDEGQQNDDPLDEEKEDVKKPKKEPKKEPNNRLPGGAPKAMGKFWHGLRI